MDITAIICTHNRADFIERAIDSAAAQSLAPERFEILVVDNGSTDDTRELVEGKMAGLANLRYLFEPRLGLSIARNAGVAQAKGRFAAFLDDDAIACEAWLERILHSFTRVDPPPGVVAGKVEPLWGAARPPWLDDEFLGPFSVIDWSDHPRELRQGEWVVGANVAFPIDLLRECGGFAENLGRKGSRLLSGEETALTRRIRQLGRTIYYDPEASVQHYVHAERLTKQWLYKRLFWGGASAGILAREARVNAAGRRKFLAKNLKRIGPLGPIHALFPANDAKEIRRKLATLRAAGMLYGFVFLSSGS